MEQKLRQMVSERSLGDIIELTGRISPEKMPQVYSQNDIFISATMQEGMSNAMLEAMASGLPIVTTHYEGVEELIADNGIVTEEEHAEAIAEAIKELADNPEEYKLMSIAARRQAEKFTWKKVADEYLNCYHEVLNSAMAN